ncbi:MAG TPA: class I SAM-dependent methyltransferase [Elusimicrobiota bacterium]|nr:class I SAM-dependent methyltransferase [Elusimicrobiota bacterium]
MDDHALTETAELGAFKRFVYQSYEKGHKIFAHAETSESLGRIAELEALLLKGLPPDKKARILDFGCGDGLLLWVAQKLGYTELAGVDLSEGMLMRARRRGLSAKFENMDGLDYLRSKPDGAYDAIAAFDVFEHLTRPELLTTCREMFRTLSPGGRLLIKVPNGLSPYCGAVLWGDITHERPHTKHSLAGVLTPLGFEDVQASEVAPVPRGLKSAIRSVLWRFVRTGMLIRLAVETGDFHYDALTLNLFVTARKAKS